MNLARTVLAFALVALWLSVSVSAQTPYAVINGSPLKIHVGADASFQIFNATAPGVGQIYPTAFTLGDMGVFADINGQLFAPDFATHGGTATGALDSYTPWQTLAPPGNPTGNGTPESPYGVGVTLRAPGTSVTANVLVTYVNGNNFFRIRTQLFGTEAAPEQVNVFVGGDIYLANSDFGYFIGVPELAAVGGHNCDPADGDYNILFIPITAAQGFAADHYAEIWRQIGVGELSNSTGQQLGCIDNGAALQWSNVFAASTAVEMRMAVSFGAVPSAANFHGFTVSVEPNSFALSAGESRPVTITTRRNVELGFDAPIALAVPDLPPGLNLTLDQPEIPAPGDGRVTGTLSVDGRIFPRIYRGLLVTGTGGGETRMGTFGVDVLCNPPMILGTAQPQSQGVPRGSSATLEADPVGEGLFTWQWYNNHWPLTGSPVPDSNSQRLVTGPVTEPQFYWARIGNPCGSIDTLTAMVYPTN